jgi:hypothetical protein
MLVKMGCEDECLFVPGLRRDDWLVADHPKGQGIESVPQTRRNQTADFAIARSGEVENAFPA